MDEVGDDLEAKVVILGDSGVGTAWISVPPCILPRSSPFFIFIPQSHPRIRHLSHSVDVGMTFSHIHSSANDQMLRFLRLKAKPRSPTASLEANSTRKPEPP